MHQCIIFPPYWSSFTLSRYPSPPTGTNHHTRTDLHSCPLFLKKRHFCLFKIAIQVVSLWHFHVCVYYILSWFVPSIFLLSTFVPFLWWLRF
jgi:hypothetical protein